MKGVSLITFTSFIQYLSPTQDNVAEDPGDDWVLPPSPAPEDRLPKLSELDDFFEVEYAIKPLGFSSIRPSNPKSAPTPALWAPA